MGIVLEGVGRMFENSKKETLSGIDLTINDGEFICVVGPSGCGKSTLINLIAGLDKPDEGHIYVDGSEVTGPGPDRVVMFQEAGLYPWLNVIENVMLGMKFNGISNEERQKRAKHYLKMVHLWDFKDYRIHELSGGMKQRAALARALCMESRVLLMDEPFSALDKQTINKLRDELQDIWQQMKMTVVFITHSMEEAIFFGDRIIVMGENPGKIKRIVENPIQRPRHIEGREFVELRQMLLSELRKEVDESEKDEYDKQ